MKKVFLSLFFMALLSVNAFSQDVPFIDVGLKLGANGASFSNLSEGEENDGLKFGLVGGAYARFKLPVIGLFVQPELQFSQMGGNTTSEDAGVVTEFETRINNLDFNLLVGQRFGVGPIGVRLNLGPTYSTVLSAKSKENGGDEVDVKEFLNTSLWSLQFGAGVDISKLSIDLRYQLGLTKLSKDENDDLKNNAIQLTLGFKLL